MKQLTVRQRDALKAKLLEEQKGLCAICLHGSFQSSGTWGPNAAKVQEVNTLDHNHAHTGCAGCEKCARGVTHAYCNRVAAPIEANPHLQNDFTRAFLKRGSGPY